MSPLSLPLCSVKAAWPVLSVVAWQRRDCQAWCPLLPVSSGCPGPGSRQALLRCGRRRAVPGARQQQGRACLCLFMLPAAPNPRNMVSVWENVFWDHATCLSPLVQVPWLRPDGFATSPAACSPCVGHSRFWDRDCKAEISWRRWLCCRPGLLSRGWQRSWVRPRVCGLDLRCQQEGLAAQAQGGSHDLASILWAIRALLSLWQRAWA